MPIQVCSNELWIFEYKGLSGGSPHAEQGDMINADVPSMLLNDINTLSY